MSTKLAFRRGVSARELAEMHRHLIEARHALVCAATVSRSLGAPHALQAASQDALMRMADRLTAAAFGMESAFMSASGDELAPFANPSNPRAWLDWLEGRHLSLVES